MLRGYFYLYYQLKWKNIYKETDNLLAKINQILMVIIFMELESEKKA
jgi:hypothetical protein